jgi:DNA-directed RNA polymerase subunit RPC12/RpoP
MSETVRQFLVRGIAAAKTNDPRDKEEARRYLNRAVSAEDADFEQRAKAWLWLSQLEDDPVKKRDCLENVLAIDPSDPLARRGLALLDGRLKPEDVVDPNQPIAPAAAPAKPTMRRYACPKCGGKLAYHPAKRALTCDYCGHRLSEFQAIQQGALVQEQDFTATLPTAKAHRWEFATLRTLKCAGCGAAFTLPPTQLSGACPFCGSAHLVETQAGGDLIQPEGVLPFQFDAEAARHWVVKWIDDLKFRPGDLDERAAVSQPHGVYLPCWTFDLGGQLKWHALIGEQRGRQTVWTPRNDLYLVYHDDLLVPASHTVSKELLDDVLEFDTKALRPYSIDLLADQAVEIYQVSMADASLVARQRALNLAREYVLSHDLAGQEVKDFQINSLGLIVESYKLALLPLWLTTYRYKNETFAAAVNGQTGQAAGQVPRSGLQKALAGLLGGG